MLDGSENEVTGLLANLFATEGVKPPRPINPGHGQPEKSKDVLVALAKANGAFETPSKGAAFHELMNTRGSGGETPEKNIQSIIGNAKKRSDDVGGITDTEAEDVYQDIYTYLMSRVVGPEAIYDPARLNLNGFVSMVSKDLVNDIYNKRARHAAGAVGGGDDETDVARDRRVANEPVHDPRAHMWEFTSDEQKVCDFLKDYLQKVLDGREPFPHDVKVRKSRDPEEKELEALPPEQREKRRTVLNLAKVFTFMTHNGLGIPKLRFAELAKILADTYGIPGVTYYRAQQWYETLWPKLSALVFVHASAIGLKGDPEEVMKSFQGKLTHRIQGQEYGKPFCEDELSNGLSDLLNVLEGWHAANR